MARVDVSASSRELVDLSAEAVRTLGQHLEQIGGIISGSQIPKASGDRGAPQRVREKLQLYQSYQKDVCKRQQECEARLASDFEKMTAWRKECGTEGADLIKEIEAYISKCRELDKKLKEEKAVTAGLRQDVADLQALCELKDRKWQSLANGFCKVHVLKEKDSYKGRTYSSWFQTAIDNIRFKFKAAIEAERLRLEHHRKMRKSRAQQRLTCVETERSKRQMQMCFLALQEECVEARSERHLKELRDRHEDEKLVMEGQIAQLLGDEEKAKQIVAEQVRRMEEARAKQKEAEKQRDMYRKKMKDALKEAEDAKRERDDALAREAQAQIDKQIAEAARDKALEEGRLAVTRAEKAEHERMMALRSLKKAEQEIKKKMKKIESLQRMLAELGAESDSDAPPDERAPPFFTNEDGSRVPRPRTRKERMSMAYREAESARIELRLGMAAMIDKDINGASIVAKMKVENRRMLAEITEVRWANKVLAAEADAAAEEAGKRAMTMTQPEGEPDIESHPESAYSSSTGLNGPPGKFGVPSAPLASGMKAVTPFSPTRPHFMPAAGHEFNGSPRVLTQSASTPLMSPALCPDDLPGAKVDKISLAPLRKVKRPVSEWRISWH